MTDSNRMVIGDYEVLGRLRDQGGGGQAIIYQARALDPSRLGLHADTPIALKVIRQHEEDDESGESRFLKTTGSLTTLRHPHIVEYYEVFVVKEDVYGDQLRCIAMELLEGEDLSKRIRRHKRGLPLERVLTIFEGCIHALAHASERGIIHRDVSPSNIFVLSDGRVKLIDFEIARHKDATIATTSAGLKGKYAYMAPEFVNASEQFRGDERSDVFSLGVCFYEALTGRLPFAKLDEANNYFAFMHRWREGHIEQPDFAMRQFEVLNPQAHEFLRRALSVDRDHRYASFAEMATALRGVGNQTLTLRGDRFLLLEFLSKGGFAMVYRARRERDGKAVAVKRLLAEHDSDRFEREARLLKNLSSRYIVRYEGFGSVSRLGTDNYFLVMEFLAGMPEWSLRGRIRAERDQGKTLHPSEVLALFRCYLRALDELHGAPGGAIIHRDITPVNLYAPPPEARRDHGAVPRLFDLGIARSDDTLTGGGEVPGNPEYMAPELILNPSFRGDPRSDIYNIGLCLYEALTGVRPYPRLPKDVTHAELWTALMQRAQGTLSISYEHPVFFNQPALAKIVRTALAPDADQRPQCARDLLRALEGEVESEFTINTTTYRLTAGVYADARCSLHLVDDTKNRKQVLVSRFFGGMSADTPGVITPPSTIDEVLIGYRDATVASDGSGDVFLVYAETPPDLAKQLLANRRPPRAGDALRDVVEPFRQLLNAVEVLHDKGIYLGPLAPRDIIMPMPGASCPRLLNWGLFGCMDLRQFSDPDWWPPEWRDEQTVEASPAIDVYSLSLSLYKALTGRNFASPLQKGKQADWSYPVFRQHKGLKDALQAALHEHPHKRCISAKALSALLAEAFEDQTATCLTQPVSFIPDTKEEDSLGGNTTRGLPTTPGISRDRESYGPNEQTAPAGKLVRKRLPAWVIPGVCLVVLQLIGTIAGRWVWQRNAPVRAALHILQADVTQLPDMRGAWMHQDQDKLQSYLQNLTRVLKDAEVKCTEFPHNAKLRSLHNDLNKRGLEFVNEFNNQFETAISENNIQKAKQFQSAWSLAKPFLVDLNLTKHPKHDEEIKEKIAHVEKKESLKKILSLIDGMNIKTIEIVVDQAQAHTNNYPDQHVAVKHAVVDKLSTLLDPYVNDVLKAVESAKDKQTLDHCDTQWENRITTPLTSVPMIWRPEFQNRYDNAKNLAKHSIIDISDKRNLVDEILNKLPKPGSWNNLIGDLPPSMRETRANVRYADVWNDPSINERWAELSQQLDKALEELARQQDPVTNRLYRLNKVKTIIEDLPRYRVELPQATMEYERAMEKALVRVHNLSDNSAPITITVDGKKNEIRTIDPAGAAVLELGPGQATIRAQRVPHAGYDAVSESFELLGGDGREWRVPRLQPKSRLIEISQIQLPEYAGGPIKTEIREINEISGSYIEFNNMTPRQPGQYQVRFTCAGYIPHDDMFTLPPGDGPFQWQGPAPKWIETPALSNLKAALANPDPYKAVDALNALKNEIASLGPKNKRRFDEEHAKATKKIEEIRATLLKDATADYDDAVKAFYLDPDKAASLFRLASDKFRNPILQNQGSAGKKADVCEYNYHMSVYWRDTKDQPAQLEIKTDAMEMALIYLSEHGFGDVKKKARDAVNRGFEKKVYKPQWSLIKIDIEKKRMTPLPLP